MASNASIASQRNYSLAAVGTLAGLAGGVMEVVWILLYQSLSGHEAAIVAHDVTASVFPDLATAPTSMFLGIAIHTALAVGLGIVIAVAIPAILPRVIGTFREPALVVLCLAGVWTTNVLVLLPIINVDFLTIVPFPVSFTSKMLFGFAAACTIWAFRSRPTAKDQAPHT